MSSNVPAEVEGEHKPPREVEIEPSDFEGGPKEKPKTRDVPSRQGHATDTDMKKGITKTKISEEDR